MKQIAKDRMTLSVISFSHMINDMYMNFLQVILPFLVISGIKIGKGTFLVSAFTVTSSIAQPVFGYIADKKNYKWLIVVGTLWMSILLCFVGIENNYLLLLVTVSIAGLGTAAFHPQASSIVRTLSGAKKGFFQAIFIACGNVGWSLTPLIIVPLIQANSLKVTVFFFIPGLIASILLWLVADKTKTEPKVIQQKIATPMNIRFSEWKELIKIMVVVVCRSLVYFSLVAFLPLFLLQKNIPIITSSKLLFIMLFTGAVGGLIGGYISDKWSRKGVITISLILAGMFLWFFVTSVGIMSWIYLAIAGAALLASFSVTVVLAQEIFKGKAAFASGLMLGLGTGIGGLGVGIFGIMTEHVGINSVIKTLICIPIIAGLFSLTIKKQNTINPGDA
jgi:FSR family fosmidomycin resistance protein-like MFS transporter